MTPGETAGMSMTRGPPVSPKFQRTFSALSLLPALIRATYQGPGQFATMQARMAGAHGSFDAIGRNREHRHARQPNFHRRSLVRASRLGGRSQGSVSRVRRVPQARSRLRGQAQARRRLQDLGSGRCGRAWRVSATMAGNHHDPRRGRRLDGMGVRAWQHVCGDRSMRPPSLASARNSSPTQMPMLRGAISRA